MNKLNRYNEQNIFDYLLTNKGQITDLFSFLQEQQINYDDFDSLPNKLYDTYNINTVTNYYVSNNITVVSNNSIFESGILPADFNFDFSLDFLA